MPTHQVTNQAPPLLGFNTAETPMIDEALRRAHVDAAQLDAIHALGALGGTAEALDWGDLAEAHPPVLKTHDRYGHRIDEVVYDPAYHRLMTVSVEHGLHAAPWAETDPNAHLVRAAKFSVWGHVDAGHGCPISMTYAVVPRSARTRNWPRSTSRCSPRRSTTSACARRSASAASSPVCR
ncbi:hypothetical protein MTP03_44210 [Tsukamurella sp. PLM1]|nr:hypothetical protein MTP03_44210 [Tsukamurella sp. PLM1]